MTLTRTCQVYFHKLRDKISNVYTMTVTNLVCEIGIGLYKRELRMICEVTSIAHRTMLLTHIMDEIDILYSKLSLEPHRLWRISHRALACLI